MRRTASVALALTLLSATVTTAAAADAGDGPVINEFVANHTGADTNAFIEVLAAPGADLSALTLLEIEGDGSVAGAIDHAETLGTADANGFWLSGEDAENGTLTFLLVMGFTGSEGNDLDTDNDGVLDTTPWSAIVDSIAVHDGGASDRTYGTTTLGVGYDGQSFSPGGASRIPNGGDTDATADWRRNDFDGAGFPGFNSTAADEDAVNTPRAANRLGKDPVPPGQISDCGVTATRISAVQGSGNTSPLDGQAVEVEAVVTGVFPGLSSIGLQEEDAQQDADPATSEGVMVTGVDTSAIAEGDLVRVNGIVDEFFGRTQIDSTATRVCDRGLSVTSATLDLPLAPSARERFEGMLVSVVDTVYVSNLFPTARFGEMVLAEGGILRTGTDVAAPGAAAAAVEVDNAARSIQIDDASNAQNRDPAPWFKDERSADPSVVSPDPDPVVRGGDSVSGLTGVLDYSFGTYEILPTLPVTFVSENPRTDAPEPVGGTLEVASFNVLNYFTTIDTGDPICGPAADQGCRGADDAQELADQRSKIVAALAALDADIVGLIEIENTAGDGPVADLVSGLNDIVGAGTYRYVETGAIGTDAIRVALIYRRAAVTPVAQHAILDSSVDARFNDEKNRPVLAQTFRVGTGEFVTVAVNHLKSKGSNCNALGDPDTGDGQGNCNLTRTAAAQAEVDWLATNPTHPKGGRILVVGDLNAYAMEDPVQVFVDAGYVDLVETLMPDDDDYSFVFDGRFGRLDHALASPSLAGAVSDATIWHVNSAEVNALTYDTRFEPWIAPGVYASSDHDPVIVGLDIRQPKR